MNKRIIAFLLAFLLAFDMFSGSVFAALDTTDPTETTIQTEPVTETTSPQTEPTTVPTEPVTEPTIAQTEHEVESIPVQTAPMVKAFRSIAPQATCPYCGAATAEDGTVTHAEDCNTMFEVDASEDVGKTAAFTMAFDEVLYADEKPDADFNYDNDAEDCDFLRTTYDYDDPAFVEITDWHWEVSGPTLWYQVAPLAGETLPDGLTTESWILQRYTNDSASIDTLVFPDVDKIGSYVRFLSATAVLYETLEDAYNKEHRWAVDGTLLSAMVVKDLYSDGISTWYYVDAAEGETWPASYGNRHYVHAKDMVDCEVCDICGKPNCDGQHTQCDICGEYDCEETHLYCLACDTFLCDKTHTYCGYCNTYDCTTDHLAENRPVTAPVLPENPTMPEGMEIAVFDEEGEPVTDGIVLSEGSRTSLSAWSADGEATDYQWQICYDSENDLWTNIQGATNQGILISPAMIRSILELQDTAAIRCVMTVDGQKQTGPVIPVEMMPRSEAASFDLRSGQVPTVAAEQPDDLKNAYVVVQFVYADGRTAARTENSSIIPGSAYTHTYEVPVIPGYKATLKNAGIQANHATLTDGELIITYAAGELAADDYASFIVEYVPDYVNVTVIHYWQNVDNDKYTQHGEPEIVTNEYKTGDTVSGVHKDKGPDNNLNSNYDPAYAGFYSLLYETPAAAADGSTVIEVYYDRYYYLMRFNLGDMGYGVDPIYARFGADLEIGTPTRAGYKFLDWKLEGEGDTIAPDDMPTTMPAGNQTYVAQWQMTDLAKVSVVFWGENPNDDEYSYQKTITIDAKPGETISWYDLKYDCGYHSHNASCGYDCGYAQEHTHGSACYSCGTEGHTHVRSCYEATGGTLAENPSDNLNNLNHYDGNIYWRRSNNSYQSYQYYLKIGNDYYRITFGNYQNIYNFNPFVNCGKSEHTHGSGCRLTCDLAEHTHEDECFTCGKVTHTHSSSCESNIGDMDAKLWDFNESKSETVTVNPDGTTVLNVYYIRNKFTLTFKKSSTVVKTIEEKWGADIHSEFPIKNGGNTIWWTVPNNCTSMKPGTQFGSLDTMPPESITFTYNNETQTGTLHYYVEVLPGEDGKTAKEIYNGFTNNNYAGIDGTKKFESYKDINVTTSGRLTYTEEFHNITGFRQYVSYPKFNKHEQGGTTDSIKTHNYLLYVRNSFGIEFYNPTEQIRKQENVPYQMPLSGYYWEPTSDLAPDKYEPGSVQFAGWYLNPDCSGKEFDFKTNTMPAGPNNENGEAALALYAKWEPVEYKVNYYLTKESLDRNETIPAEMARLVNEALANGTISSKPADDPYSVVFAEDVILHGSYIGNLGDPGVSSGYEEIHPRAGYEFIGWFYRNEDGEETAFDPENMPVDQDLDLYGKWSANKLCKYNVYFALDFNNDGQPDRDTSGNIIYIAAPISGSGIAGRTYTFAAKGGEELDPAYRDGYFPIVGSHSIIIDIADEEGTGNNSFIFLYQQKPAVPYTVRYLDSATGDSVLVDGIPMADKVVSDNKNVVVTENFVYIPGYMPDAYQKTLVVTANGESENVITFFYTKDEVHALYVVNYYIQELNGDLSHKGWSKYHSEQYTGIIENEYYADAVTLDGFTLSPVYTDDYNTVKKINGMDRTPLPAEVSELTGNKITGTLTDKGMELNFYYTRNLYPYEFRYMLNGTTTKLAPTKVGLAGYDTVVTEAAQTIRMDLDGDGIMEDYSLYDPTETIKDIHIKIDGEALSPGTTVQEGTAKVNVATFYYVRCTQTMSITKTVANEKAWDDPNPDPNQEFRFRLRIHAKDGYHRTSYDYETSDGTTGTVSPEIAAPDTLLFTLKAGQTITIQGLPTAEYTLTELELPTGYYYESSAPAPQENGRYKLTVDAEVNVTVSNIYKPANLTISKTVDIVEDNDNIPEVEAFVFTIRGPAEFDGTYLCDLDSIYATEPNLSPKNSLQASNGTATVTLEKGKRIRILNLPEGDYTVTEADYSAQGYNSDFSINGIAPHIQDVQAAVTMVRGETQTIAFVNRFPVGDLVIEKTVDKEFFRTAWTGDEFTFTVTRTTVGRPLTTGNRYKVLIGGAEQLESVYYEDGQNKLTVEIPFSEDDAKALLSDDASEHKTLTKTLTIKNLPAGTYEVTESADSDYVQTANSETLTVSDLVLPSENTVKATFTNTVKRKTGSLYLEKELVAAPGFTGELPTGTKFTFTIALLEQIPSGEKTIPLIYSPAPYSDGTAAATTATMSGGKFTVTLEAGQNVTMISLPEGMYQIIESTIPSYANAFAHIASDNTETVQPTQTTADGQMYTEILVAPQAAAKVKCTNTYPVDRAELIIQKLVKSEYPWDPVPGSFTFTVTLAEDDKESYTYQIYNKNGTPAGEAGTATVTDKQFTITLEAGQYAVIPKMPVCEYTVAETVDPNKFRTNYAVYLSETGEAASTTVNTAEGITDSGTGASVTRTFLAGKTDAIVFTNARKYASLTIQKENAEADQVFVYEVKNTVTNEVITVTVTGNGSTTIHGLIPGTEYTVTQKNDWSWRYNDSAQSFELPADGKTITFDEPMQHDRWLDGNSALVKNRYTPTGG